MPNGVHEAKISDIREDIRELKLIINDMRREMRVDRETMCNTINLQHKECQGRFARMDVKIKENETKIWALFGALGVVFTVALVAFEFLV